MAKPLILRRPIDSIVRRMTNWQNYQWLHSGMDLHNISVAIHFSNIPHTKGRI